MFWLHAVIIAVAIAVAYSMYIKTLRIRSSFNLYRVRDQFVYLVASGVLEEDDPVFKYYYERINLLLKLSPNVGVDDILQTLMQQYKKSPEKFNEYVSKAKSKADRLSEEPSFQNVEVKAAVVAYFQAIKLLVLCHSSVLRLGYVVSHYLLGSCMDHFKKLLPENLRHGVQIIEYADSETESFAH